MFPENCILSCFLHSFQAHCLINSLATYMVTGQQKQSKFSGKMCTYSSDFQVATVKMLTVPNS